MENNEESNEGNEGKERETGLLDNPQGNEEGEKIESDEASVKTFYQRFFSPMKDGSLRGSIFTTSSMALGTGCLSLANYCTKFGCVWFLVFLIVGAFAAYWSLNAMITSARKTTGTSFSPTVKIILGNAASKVLDVFLIVYLFGIMIQYQVIIYQLIGRIIQTFFVDHNKYPDFEKYEEGFWDKYYVKFPVMLGIAALASPLCLLRDISKMRFTSMLGIIALSYTILVVAIESPWFYSDYKKNVYKKDIESTHANWFDFSKCFSKNLDFFTGMATIFFSFCCHAAAFPVYKTMKNSNDKRMKKVFRRACILILTINFIIALTGFLTTPLKPKSLVIFRDSVFENDIFMHIAKIALALDLFLCLPVNFNGFRSSFFLLIFKKEEIDQKRNVLVCIPTLLITVTIGALYKDILAYISLLGGFCCAVFCFLIPGSMLMKTSGEPYTSARNVLRFILTCTLVLFGFMGGIQTIRKTIIG